jgi:hypothetical protein
MIELDRAVRCCIQRVNAFLTFADLGLMDDTELRVLSGQWGEFAIPLDGYYFTDYPLLFNNTVVEGATFPLTECGVIEGGLADRSTTWCSIAGTGRHIFVDTCSEERVVDTQIAVYKASDRYGCGEMECVVANDVLRMNGTIEDLCSMVDWTSEDDIKYYVLVTGYNESQGLIPLNVDKEPAPHEEVCTDSEWNWLRIQRNLYSFAPINVTGPPVGESVEARFEFSMTVDETQNITATTYFNVAASYSKTNGQFFNETNGLSLELMTIGAEGWVWGEVDRLLCEDRIPDHQGKLCVTTTPNEPSGSVQEGRFVVTNVDGSCTPGEDLLLLEATMHDFGKDVTWPTPARCRSGLDIISAEIAEKEGEDLVSITDHTTLYGPQDTADVSTYDDAVAFCLAKGHESLASLSEYCGFGGEQGELASSALSSDEWAPISDRNGCFVQVGDGGAATWGHPTCILHTSVTGSNPKWGVTPAKETWESNYVLCSGFIPAELTLGETYGPFDLEQGDGFLIITYVVGVKNVTWRGSSQRRC